MPWIEIRHRRALQLTSLIILLLLFQRRLRWIVNQVTFPDPGRLGREDLAVDAAGQCNPRNESFIETGKNLALFLRDVVEMWSYRGIFLS